MQDVLVNELSTLEPAIETFPSGASDFVIAVLPSSELDAEFEADEADDGVLGRLGYRLGLLGGRLARARNSRPATSPPAAADQYRHVVVRFDRTVSRRKAGWRAVPEMRANAIMAQLRELPVVREGMRQVVGPHGANLFLNTVGIADVAVRRRSAGELTHPELRELIVSAVPAMVGCAACLISGSILEANAIAVTTATAIHVARTLAHGHTPDGAKPLGLSLAVGSLALVGLALFVQPLGAAFALTMPSPLGWTLIAGGVLAALFVDRLCARLVPRVASLSPAVVPVPIG